MHDSTLQVAQVAPSQEIVILCPSITPLSRHRTGGTNAGCVTASIWG